MRLFIRKHILDLLSTVKEAISYIEKSFEDRVTCIEVLKNCANALFSIESSLKSGFSIENYQNNYESNVQYLIRSIEYIASKLLENKNIGEYKKDSFKKIECIVNQINNDNEVKLEIVFLPYKASMWDSLESVWLAAKDDDKCNAYVIPIPYYDRDSTGRLSDFHYEGNDFPSYVPIHDYKSYVISARRPDIIYIHNPYDGYNRVTSIAPEYYSDKLKKYTDMLVYIPYYIAGVYIKKETAANKILTMGVKNADQVIVQSNNYRDLFLENGIDGEKVQALGSPKFDVLGFDNVINMEWQKLFKDKKIILLNLTLGTVLSDDIWLERYEKIISDLASYENIFILLRPHPLMEATLVSMRPHLVSKYKQMISDLKSNEKIVFDTNKNLDLAMKYSDAMISTYSSLVFKYLLTGKPVLSVINNNLAKISDEKSIIFDYLKNYFCVITNEYSQYLNSDYINKELSTEYQENMEYISLDDFISIIKTGKDYNKQNRLKAVENSVSNIGENCGKKTHSFILNKILGEKK